jgi:tetratricopeptide (TPR) repeat protein
LFDIHSGQIRPLRHEQGVTGAQFSADGRYLLTTNLDNVVRIWDPSRGELVRSLRPEAERGLWYARFSDDSQRVVTYTFGETSATTRAGFVFLRVWDVATGQPLSTLMRERPYRGPLGAGSQDGRWSAAADRFVLQDDEQFVVHDLSADERPIENLVRLARVLSGRRVNHLGNIETLSQDELQQQWEASSVVDVRDRLQRAPQGVDWHRLQAKALADSDRSAAIWHLTRLIEADPDDAQSLADRGKLLAGLGDHEQAVADYGAALAFGQTTVRRDRANSLAYLARWDEVVSELKLHQQEQEDDPNVSRNTVQGRGRQSWVLQALGIACLMSGDVDGYEQVCQDILSTGENQPVSTQFMPVPLLIPRDKEYCEAIENMLDDRSVRISGSVGSMDRGGIVARRAGPVDLRVLFAFRRGDSDRIVERFDDGAELTSAADLFVLAMAHKQLGDDQQSMRLFDRALDAMGDVADDISQWSPLPINRRVDPTLAATVASSRRTWLDIAIAEILRREAKKVIEANPKGPTFGEDD